MLRVKGLVSVFLVVGAAVFGCCCSASGEDPAISSEGAVLASTAQSNGRIGALSESKTDGTDLTAGVMTTGENCPRRLGVTTYPAACGPTRAITIDSANGFGYFAADGYSPTNSSEPAKIVKMRLSDRSVVGTPLAITLPAGAPAPRQVFGGILSNGYLYYGTATVPGYVVRINISTFTIDKTLKLTKVTGELRGGIEYANRLYFACCTDPGQIAKIDVTTFTEMDGYTGTAGESFFWVAARTKGVGYFATNTNGAVYNAAKVVRFGLSQTSPPSRQAAFELNRLTQGYATAIAANYTEGDVFIGTSSVPAYVFRLGYNSASGSFVVLNANSLSQTGEDREIYSSLLYGDKVCFGTGSSPGRVVSFTQDNLQNDKLVGLNKAENILVSAALDTSTNTAYFGTYSNYGRAAAVLLDQKPGIYGTKVSLSNKARVRSVSGYSHVAGATIQFAILDSAMKVCWKSGSMPTVATNWCTANVDQSLVLPAGDYWLAFASSQPGAVASHAGVGSAGTGFYVGTQTVPEVGTALSVATSDLTADRWSEYLTYDEVPALALGSASAPVSGLGGQVSFAVINTGKGTLQWKATTSEPWLHIGNVSGALAEGKSETVSITCDATTVVRSGYVTVSDPEAEGSPQTFRVDQRLTNPPSSPVVSVTPERAQDDEDLACSIVTESVSGSGGPVTYSYSWSEIAGANSRKGVLSTSHVLSANLTVPGRLYLCQVTPNDGESDGASAWASAYVLEPSSVELSGLPAELTLGSPVTLSGTVAPTPQASSSIDIVVSPQGGSALTLPTLISNTTSVYSTVFYPNRAGSWTAEAKWSGDPDLCLPANSVPISFSVAKAQPSLKLSLNTTSALSGFSELVATATLSIDALPETLKGILAGRRIALYVKKPGVGGAVLDPLSGITDGKGEVHFDLTASGGSGIEFLDSGDWKFRAAFTEDADLLGATTPGYDSPDSATLRIRGGAGYAIIVAGQFGANGEGRAEHVSTTDFVYRCFRDRGFAEDDINYLRGTSFVGAAPGDIKVNPAQPSKASIEEALTQWALGKMTVSPAPLYVVLVDHGGIGVFHVYSGPSSVGFLTPQDLGGYLTRLEDSLASNGVAEQDLAVVYGACHSGSFVSGLARSGHARTIITSTAANEVSHRGVKVDKDVRDGEVFVSEFFRHAVTGKNLKECFELASDKVAVYTAPSTHASPSSKVQTPQLDDNGDGVSSDRTSLSFSAGWDGARAYGLTLGYGVNAEPSAGWLWAKATIVLEPDSAMMPLDALCDKPKDASLTAWLEVKTPVYAGATPVSSDPGAQEAVVLSRVTSDGPATDGAFHWSDLGTLFDLPGAYKVFYYVRDGNSVSSPVVTTVYRKSAEAGQPPVRVELLFPADNATVNQSFPLAWTASSSPGGWAVTYRVEVSTSDEFPEDGLLVFENLGEPFLRLSAASGIQDKASYYWRVYAVDEHGLRSESSETRHFTVDNTNGTVTSLRGTIADTQGPLEGATVTLSSGGEYVTGPDGTYLFSNLIANQGTVVSCSIRAEAPGHEAGSRSVAFSLYALGTADLVLERSAVARVTPQQREVASAGGYVSFDVANDGEADMPWTAAVTQGNDWLHLVSGVSGTGAGTIGLACDASQQPLRRTGVVTLTANGAAGSPATMAVVQYGLPPTVSLECPAANPTNSSPIRIAATFSEAVTGLTQAGVRVQNGTVSGVSGSGANYLLDVVPAGQGGVVVQIAANAAYDADGFGNIVSNVVTREFDDVAPNAPTVTGPVITNNRQPTWSWASGGNGGAGAYRYRLDAWDLTTSAIGTTNMSFAPAQPLGDGQHVLYVQERDQVGNWSASGSFTVTIDTTAPGAPSVSGSASPTNNQTPTWTWLSGGGSGQYRYRLDNADVAAEPTLTQSVSFTPAAPLGAAAHTLYVQESDSAGNWSSAGSFSITVVTLVTVSGRVTRDGQPLAGVTLSGFPGIVLTDADGRYSTSLSATWQGTVTPTLAGHTFAPSARTYSALTGDRANEDYAAACGVILPPQNVQATDGDYSGYVHVTWNAVTNALRYEVYRADTPKADTAVLLTQVQTPTLAFDDISAAAPTVAESEGSGCNGGGTATPQFHAYYYFVKALSNCDDSAFSSGDSGYRGLATAKAAGSFRESVLPCIPSEDGLTLLAEPESSLSIRLRANAPIDADSVWGVVIDGGLERTSVEWIGNGPRDGWVVCRPDRPWSVGERVTMTVSASTEDGRVLAPIAYTFEIREPSGYGAAATSESGDTSVAEVRRIEEADKVPAPSCASRTALFRIGIAEAYREPQLVWLPVAGAAPLSSIRLDYFHEGANARWIPAADVDGWIVPGTERIRFSGGTRYLGFQVRHSGVVCVSSSEPPRGEASVLPLPPPHFNASGDFLVLLGGALLLYALGRRRTGPGRKGAES